MAETTADALIFAPSVCHLSPGVVDGLPDPERRLAAGQSDRLVIHAAEAPSAPIT